jgi:hypothetical protein
MDDADRPAFRELVTALAANCDAEISKAHFHLLWLGLEDLPYPQVRAACVRALKECERMPSVARIRTLAGRGPDVRPYHLPPGYERQALPEQRGWPQLRSVPRGEQSTAGELVDALGASQAAGGGKR